MTGSADESEASRFWPRLAAALAEVPREDREPPTDARVGAVLILLEDTAAGPSVVLTRRRRDLRSHPGQVSFPGGRVDPGEGHVEAALREAREEVGLDPASVDVVGVAPTFYIPPSRFWVVPVVARWRAPHRLRENPWEVDAVLHAPVAQLLDPARWRHAPLSARGSSWAWDLDDDVLWGATAFALASLLDVAIPGWHGGVRPQDLGEDRAVAPWEAVPTVQRRARLTGDLPVWRQESVPHVTRSVVRRLRGWLAERGVGQAVAAEHAGRPIAHAVRRLMAAPLDEVAVTVLAGPSRNGAAGLAAARLLAAGGADVEVRLLGEPRIPDQVRLLADSGVAVHPHGSDASDAHGFGAAHPPGDVVVDAVLGLGVHPPLHGVPEAAMAWMRRYATPIVAVELPSGIASDEGLKGPCIAADVTVALGLPLQALRERIVHAYLGDVYLADLGIPPAAWRAVGVDHAPTFARGPLVRLTASGHGSDAATPDQGERVVRPAPE